MPVKNKERKSLILIRGARIIDCEAESAVQGDILLSESRRDGGYTTVAVGEGVGEGVDCREYDARGKYAVPSFIDLHCHLRDPGAEYKEDIISGTAAAAAGGYGTVVAMPNTSPVIDNPATLTELLRRADEWGMCRVLQTAAITVGQRGEELCDFDALAAAGAVAFTDDGRPVSDAALMTEAMKRCAAGGYLIISHSEECSLSKGGVINEGATARHLGVRGIPDTAESVAIARELLLAEQTGCRLHIAHVSTRAGFRMIREAKSRGVRVTCETCPHYFAFTDNDVVYYGTNAKMNPPLRSRDNLEAVIEAIADGTVDCISTDHAPHAAREKSLPLAEAPFGVTGLQTAFGAAITYLVLPGHISLYRAVQLFTTGPASILGKNCRLCPGERSGVTLFTPSREMIVSKNMLKSKSFNTPFLGLTLYGCPDEVFI